MGRLGQALGALAGNEIEVRGGAADHRAQRDHRHVFAGMRQLVRGQRDLPRAGDTDQLDRVVLHPVADEHVACPGHQRFHDEAVEAAGDDGKTALGRGEIAFDGLHLWISWERTRAGRLFYGFSARLAGITPARCG